MLRSTLFRLCLVGLLAGCASGPFSTAGRDASVTTLRAGVAADFPPIVYKRDGDILGVEADLRRVVAAAINQDIEFVEMPWTALIPSLEAQRIDLIVSGMSVTAERQERVRFIRPYLRVGQMALLRTRDIGAFSDPNAFERIDRAVGFERGTTGENLVESRLRLARPVPFDSVEDGVRALREGRIAAFVHDAPTVWRVAGAPGEKELIGLYRPLTEEHLAWAVGARNEALRERLNTVFSELDRNGQLQQILDRWIPLRVEVR